MINLPDKKQLSLDALSILMREYERVCTDIRTIESANDRLVTLGLTAIGAGLSYGFIANKVEIFLILPVMIIAIFIYATINHHHINFMGGYKGFMEDRINTISDEPLLIWEKVVSSRPNPSVMAVALGVAYVAVFISITVLGFQKIFAVYTPESGSHVGIYYSILLIVMSVLLLLSVRQMSRGFRKGRELAEKIFSDAQIANVEE